MRLVARYADVWNAAGGDPQKTKELIEKLDQACAEIGRDASEIRRSVQFDWDGKSRDELMEPYVVVRDGRPVGIVGNRDSVIFFNFRADRARQLTWALMKPDFDGFARKRWPRDLFYVTMTEYKVGLGDVKVAYPAQKVISIAEILSGEGIPVARRTVAKYREAMGIAPSNERKRAAAR